MTQPDAQPVRLQEFLPKAFAVPEQPLEDALRPLAENTERYLQWLRAVPDDVLHVPCAPGKWSPAEHADHIVRTNALSVVLIGAMCEGLPAPQVEPGFVFPDGRLVTAEPLHPVAGRDRDELLRDVAEAAGALQTAATRARDLGRLDEPCVPTQIFGLLSPLEMVQLAIVHYGMHMKSAASA